MQNQRLKFSTTIDGTHQGGTEYTTVVNYNGTPGSAHAYTEIKITKMHQTFYTFILVEQVQQVMVEVLVDHQMIKEHQFIQQIEMVGFQLMVIELQQKVINF